MTEMHPWYGPCDALAKGGKCAECMKHDTRDRLEEILEIESKATEEPWHLIRDYEREAKLSPYEPEKIRYCGIDLGRKGGFSIHRCPQPHENIKLIHASRKSIKPLITLLLQAEGALLSAKTLLEKKYALSGPTADVRAALSAIEAFRKGE